MIGCSIRVVTVLLGYLDLLIATSCGPIFGIWGPPKSWGPRRLPTLPTPKAGPGWLSDLSQQDQRELFLQLSYVHCGSVEYVSVCLDVKHGIHTVLMHCVNLYTHMQAHTRTHRAKHGSSSHCVYKNSRKGGLPSRYSDFCTLEEMEL